VTMPASMLTSACRYNARQHLVRGGQGQLSILK
jgi:hypothetical protein